MSPRHQSSRPKWPLFTVLSTLLAMFTLNLSPCSAVSFNLQELTHDSPAVDIEKRRNISNRMGETVDYFVKSAEPNHTLRLFLSKPFKVRKAELDSISFNLRQETLVEVVEQGESPRIRWKNLCALHRGNYSLYRFEFDAYNQLVDYSRTDFNLVVTNLKTRGAICDKNEQCESDHCLRGRCVCSEDAPVYVHGSCFPAKSLNESCQVNAECQLLAGPNAECYDGWKKCRCDKSSVHHRISNLTHHCFSRLVPLYDRCLYSMECSLTGANRYCGANYQCECLPGYRLEHGRHCTSSGSQVSAQLLQLLLAILAFHILCL